MMAPLSPEYIKARPLKAYSRLVSDLLFEGRPLTTRGRWIPPFVFTLLSLEKKLFCPKKVKKPVFVVGTGRSGTTIWGVVLFMHEEVGFLNEPKALWHEIYPYEDLIGNYTKKQAFYRLNKYDVSEDIKKAAHRLFGWYLTLSFSDRVVDKSPDLTFRMPFLKAIFPDAKFLFLIRNGKDVCYSIQKWSKRCVIETNGEIHDWWGADNRKRELLLEQVVKFNEDLSSFFEVIKNFVDHLNREAVEWILSMKEGLKFIEIYKNDILPVCYEKVTDSPKKTLIKICEFCELEEDEIKIFYAKLIMKTFVIFYKGLNYEQKNENYFYSRKFKKRDNFNGKHIGKQ